MRGNSGVLAMCVLVSLGALAQLAHADTLKTAFRSHMSRDVHLEFYSQDRDQEWPPGRQTYTIRDNEIHKYELECRTGEKICFGAQIAGDRKKYWGVSLGNDQSCRACCQTCGQSDIRLYELQ